jgi:hypothetical protein
MSKKVGRNDPCPCGSGKKYKKCCLDKTQLQAMAAPSSELDKLKAEFENYDQSELIATIGGLQLYPENHSKTIRLEVAARVASSIKSVGTKKIELDYLQKILNKYLPADGPIGIMEDPIESLFTENIVFHGGNFIIYPGITDRESFILRTLFQTISHHSEGLSKGFVAGVEAISLSLLTLSNEVSTRMGHSRHMDSPDTWRKDIKIPESNQNSKLSNAVKFTKQEINALLESQGLNFRFLSPFIIPVGEKRIEEEDLMKNPLLVKPFVEMDDNIILAIPGSIIGALRHFIWVTAQKFGLLETLANRFREVVWMSVQQCLRLMFFKPIELDLPAWEGNLPVKEGIYEIDTDKLAYVHLIVDDATNYARDKPHDDMWKLDDLPQKIDGRREAVANWLTTGKCPHCREVFLITILGTIGRAIFLGFDKLPNNSRT